MIKVVLSLFDGMSCGQITLRELGITPETYYASEIDKYAISQTQLNFPDTIQLGSVTEVDVTKLKYIDLLIGGSPCQSFSFAGKRKGMATKCDVEIYTLEKYLQLKSEGFEFEGQSYLFWEYMRILTDIRKYNPDVKFMLENVEMGNKWERVLSEAIGIYGVHINSALVSAQNRKRIYWTNIRTRQEGLFGELHSDIPQPADRGILLKDILESEVDEKYYLSDKMISWIHKHEQKSIDNGNGFRIHTQDNDKALSLSVSQLKQNLSSNYVSESICLTPKRTEYGKQIRKQYEAGEVSAMRKEVSQLEPREDGKTNTITTVQKDNLVMQLNPSKESGGVQPYQQNRVYDPNGISPCLNTDARPHAIIISEATEKGFIEIQPGECFDFENPNSKTRRGRKMEEKSNCLMAKETDFMQYTSQQRIRRLTPTECARLQGVPDWYKWACSDTQQYRMLGNGWQIDTIKHIFSFL